MLAPDAQREPKIPPTALALPFRWRIALPSFLAARAPPCSEFSGRKPKKDVAVDVVGPTCAEDRPAMADASRGVA